LGGPAPYWQSWTFNDIGNRLTEVSHTSAGDTTKTYTYPASGAARPHALTSVTTSGPTGSSIANYSYDNAGNTTSRPGSTTAQTLDWDTEGRLAQLTDGSQQHENVYTADGDRLIRRDATGKTLYLPGMEIRYTTSTETKAATRYYSYVDGVFAMRDAFGHKWLVTDHHSTQNIAISHTGGQAVTQRRQTPYGEPRGTSTPTWPNLKGFVGGDIDPTGLTHIGARQYEPQHGRFISVDPIMDLTDLQQMHGYSYSNNNPVTWTDPTGLRVCGDLGCNQYATPKPGGGHTVSGTPRNETCMGSCQKYSPAPTSTPAPAVNVAQANTESRANPTPEVSPWGDGMAPPTHSYSYGSGEALCPSVMWCVHFVLFACGLAPYVGEPCDITGAVVSAAEGDWEGALLSAGSAIPVLGYAGAAGKGAKLFDKYNDLRKACSSFTPGTHVLMADGTKKPIEDVEIGDYVIATDPETGQTAAKVVVATIIGAGTKNLAEVIVDVHGNQGDKVERVLATDNHPFWDPDSETWTTAGGLAADDQLLTATGGRVEVVNTRPWTTNTPVHNLTIADIHTYYVIAGNVPVLVHNDGGDVPKLTGSQTIWRGGPYRIDVEQGPGGPQMHLQEQINGVKSSQAPKYQYNFETGEFEGMSKSLRKTLDKKYPSYRGAIPKGARYLGIQGFC
ncbi:RHS repeat-associated core domain-containing protein, partial [Micromonospora sp. LOL_023]|uniref:RHS repeat-associated core domain-containing protein n=1 Tax=Micromonospora sp. LOL_023 TaxID=3345418 RepID=UPI003A8B3532